MKNLYDGLIEIYEYYDKPLIYIAEFKSIKYLFVLFKENKDDELWAYLPFNYEDDYKDFINNRFTIYHAFLFLGSSRLYLKRFDKSGLLMKEFSVNKTKRILDMFAAKEFLNYEKE